MASSIKFLLSLMVMVLVLINGELLVKGYPEEDLVKKLPGQPEFTFKQYAGYVDVDSDAGRSLYYYFVEAHAESQFKPLTLWLTGGPGCSSIGQGAFTEIGPFLPHGDGHSLRFNKMSWNRVSNLLFVDAPAGVGWSYSNKTNDMYIFLMKWLEKFPEFKYTDLFLTGETYAGLLIGNPVLKIDRDLAASYDFLWSHGIISDEIFLTIKRECDFEEYVRSTRQNVSKTCDAALDTAIRMTGNIDFYNVILDTCSSNVEEQLRLKKTVTKISYGVDVCMEYEIDVYLNLPQVQHALHANRTKLPYKWSKCSQLSHTCFRFNAIRKRKLLTLNFSMV
ncbi:putative carboxypeptidase D [Dioscorea sansibarensis]